MTAPFDAAQHALLKAAHEDEQAETLYWRQCDANNGGTITVSELQQWLGRHFPAFNNKLPLQQVHTKPRCSNHKPPTPTHKPQTANTNPQTTNPHPLPNCHTQAFKLAALADPKKLAEVLRGDRKMNLVTSLKRMHFKNLLLSVVCVARARARVRVKLVP
jgi:hypothetical protein